MERHNVKRLPVVNGAGLVGIISRSNLLHAVIVGSPRSDRGPVADPMICEKIAAELDAQPWAPRGSVTATVTNGIVDLNGDIRDKRQRTAMRVAVEGIAGAREVGDHLRMLDPRPDR
jgi:osmotically-inducible protein OsmY